MEGKKFASVILLALLMLTFSVRAIEGSLAKRVNEGNAVLLQVNQDTVNVRLDRISTDREGSYFAVISVRSRYLEQPITNRFYIGESKRYDTNLDGQEDLEITLESTIGSGRADLVFTELSTTPVVRQPETARVTTVESAPVREVTRATEEPEAQPTRTGTEPITGEAVSETGKSSNRAVGWTILAAVVVIGFIVYIATRKKPAV